MDMPRSSFYAAPDPAAKDPIIDEIRSITENCRNYGYRRVTAELRRRALVVNSKKVRRIMRQNGLNPKQKRRYVVTTDSSHESPIYPNVAKGFEVHGPDQLWIGDITYVAIRTGFVYLAVILDAWSRKVVGYGLSRNFRRAPHRGGAEDRNRIPAPAARMCFPYRQGSPICRVPTPPHPRAARRRRGNPYDNAQAESFMKTLEVEVVYATEYETLDDVAADLPASSRTSTTPPDYIRRSVI